MGSIEDQHAVLTYKFLLLKFKDIYMQQQKQQPKFNFFLFSQPAHFCTDRATELRNVTEFRIDELKALASRK